MTLSEIETILGELASRHPNLTKELLTTLLLAAGWEERNIQDALTLFKEKGVSLLSKKQIPDISSSSIAPQQEVSAIQSPPPESKLSAAVSTEAITFYKQDGEEEGELHIPPPSSQKREKEEVVVPVPQVSAPPLVEEQKVVLEGEQKIEEKKEEVVEKKVKTDKEVSLPEKITITEDDEWNIGGVARVEIPFFEQEHRSPLVQEKEPESLIVHDEQVKPRVARQETEIPDNLPLLPFESSPHVWEFSRYKDVFHGEVMPTKEAVQAVALPSSQEEGVEEVFEKTPLTKGDESLVFLAGVMLLVIILILGYMYSNGRL